jgi:hypothetical protein
MAINRINPNLWITISSRLECVNGHECTRTTSILNLDNGCMIRELLIRENLNNSPITQSIQFIPDINIELNKDNEVIQKLSKHSSILQPIIQYVPNMTQYEQPTTTPIQKGVEIICNTYSATPNFKMDKNEVGE